ncbi:MAG: HupE/UreJ family protein [Sulfurimicrobium sp.]|jgi:urease accessory protein|nr:HupE/UreJ family protein [Sulfurimicrobium sp.]
MKKSILLALLVLMPVSAWAHPGHAGSGLWSGFIHPFSGLDHILAMIAVGVWAARNTGKKFWLPPAAFLAGMIGGGLLGFEGLQPTFMESAIAASALAAGLLATLAMRLPLAAQAAIAALFAVWHGIAHGMELPVATAPQTYVIGFLAATALLLSTGLVLGKVLQRANRDRWLGAGMTALAATLFLS